VEGCDALGEDVGAAETGDPVGSSNVGVIDGFEEGCVVIGAFDGKFEGENTGDMLGEDVNG
jgi:hypothetical protein